MNFQANTIEINNIICNIKLDLVCIYFSIFFYIHLLLPRYKKMIFDASIKESIFVLKLKLMLFDFIF